MNRMILTMIGIAALAGSIATAAAQEHSAANGGQAQRRYADTNYSQSYGRPADDWSDREVEASGRVDRPAQAAGAPALVAGTSKSFTTQDWVDQLDRRVGRQEAALDTALRRTQYFVAVLLLLIGGSIAYLWVRLSQMAAKCDRLQECLESPVTTQPEKAAPSPATAASVGVDRKASSATTRQVAVSGIPRVQVLAGVIDRLVAGINESRRRRGDVETGYALVGKITGEGASRLITVNGLIDEGPNSARSGGHHKADRDHQQR